MKQSQLRERGKEGERERQDVEVQQTTGLERCTGNRRRQVKLKVSWGEKGRNGGREATPVHAR